MKILTGIIAGIILLAIFSCKRTKNGIVEENKELIRFIETEIFTNNNIYKVGKSIELSMKVTNIGETKYTFLPWGTPIENSLTGDCLMIKHNNQVLDYIGIMVKRVPPTKKDYVTLKHNETVSGKINILDGYSLNKKGVYTIQYKEGKGLPKSKIIEIEIR